MRSLVLPALALAALAVAPAVGAYHVPECVTPTLFPEDAESRTHPVYLVLDDQARAGYTASVWLYVESNGVTGLQRHDEYCQNGEWTQDSQDLVLFGYFR